MHPVSMRCNERRNEKDRLERSVVIGTKKTANTEVHTRWAMQYPPQMAVHCIRMLNGR